MEEVLESPGEDRPGQERSRIKIGQTASGRYLRVIYIRDPKADSAFIVTAYELRGKPLLSYAGGKGGNADEKNSLADGLV